MATRSTAPGCSFSASKTSFGQRRVQTAVTMSNVPLLAGTNRSRCPPWVQGRTRHGQRLPLQQSRSGYYSALGIPLIAGREFTDADTVNSAKVALVNQTFAKKFPSNDAVGKLMGWAPGEGYRSKLDTTIVGVVEDASYSEVKQTAAAILRRIGRTRG